MNIGLPICLEVFITTEHNHSLFPDLEDQTFCSHNFKATSKLCVLSKLLFPHSRSPFLFSSEVILQAFLFSQECAASAGNIHSRAPVTAASLLSCLMKLICASALMCEQAWQCGFEEIKPEMSAGRILITG